MNVIKKRRKRVISTKTGIKQIQLTVYFYPDEFAPIQAAADAEGISVSGYVVKAAMEKLAALHSSKK
jgi:uncharacterized protein (DUF1778 family)